MINDYLIFITLAITITAIPGPTVILTIKNSLRYGTKAAVANIVGNFIAMIILATLSALGLGAIILTSSPLFATVKVLGCGYLIYLGIKAWRAPLVQGRFEELHPKRNKTLISVFKQGFTVGITNPKAIAFFTALFPQFIDQSREYFPQFLVLILTIEGISCSVLVLYALLSALVEPHLVKNRSTGIFNKLTAIAFVSFGLALIYED